MPRPQVYGVWAWRLETPLIKTDSFPPVGAEYIGHVADDGKTEFDDIPKYWLEQRKKDDATHIMLGRGDHIELFTIDGEEPVWGD